MKHIRNFASCVTFCKNINIPRLQKLLHKSLLYSKQLTVFTLLESVIFYSVSVRFFATPQTHKRFGSIHKWRHLILELL